MNRFRRPCSEDSSSFNATIRLSEWSGGTCVDCQRLGQSVQILFIGIADHRLNRIRRFRIIKFLIPVQQCASGHWRETDCERKEGLAIVPNNN
ncbi:hypothetical protein MCEMSEM18_03397 [Comamonadaceae bacterium]